MRKTQKRFLAIIALVITFAILMINSLKLQANTENDSVEIKGELKEFSEEFKRYLQLSEEEREGVYPPRPYDIVESTYVPNNQLKVMRTIGSTYARKYSLREDIPENVEIKDQMTTNMCWTFSALSSLETNLALSDIYNNRAKKVYDFSERHMEYATVRELGGKENIYGFNRRIDSGGLNINKQDLSYLTNGMGAIKESEMPFSTDMSMQNLSYIQNKDVVTQVYDIVEFSNLKSDELMDKMKNHIKNYGSINVNIYGASPSQEYVEKEGKLYYCYNNATGAIYCDNANIFEPNHAVSLIGWDDDYVVENFNANNRPSAPGAWIVRNSWGTNSTKKISYIDIKESMYRDYYIKDDAYKKDLERRLEEENLNWSSANDITDAQAEKFAISMGYVKDSNGQFYLKVGDNGIMYISYYDCNVYSYMTGIEKAKNKVSYDHIYQYDELGTTAVMTMQNPNNYKAWIGNVFDRKEGKTEYLTQVAIYAPEKYTCKVWVNPNSSSKKREDMIEAKLKEGETVTFEPGYHTIELAEPIELTSSQFFVALQIETFSNNGKFELAMEGLWDKSVDNKVRWDCVKKEEGKTFMNLEGEARHFDIGWRDISTIEGQYLKVYWIKGGDSTLKAFTTDTIKDDTIKEIKVTKEPDKTEYFVGEKFDKTGMIVTGYLNNGDTIEIEDYIISDGEKIGANQTSVTIKYEEFVITQPIKVTRNAVESLIIKQPAEKLEYKAGEDFDSTGMIVEATFTDGTVEEISDYEISDGKDLKNGQESVSIVYQDKSVSQEIKVNPNAVVKIEITTPPNKKEYVEGQDFNRDGMVITATYEDGTVKNVTSYTVEDGVKLNKDQNKIIIKFEDKIIEQEIVVREKKILAIEIKNKPTKTKYIQYNDELDVNGGSIVVKYNDGSSEEIEMSESGVTFEGFDNTKLGKNDIKVKYLDFETSFEVEIIEEVKELPENSDFSKAVAKNKIMKMYYYTNNSNNNYATMTIEISNITKATVNDSLSYKYYLSSNQDEKTIQDSSWLELKNAQINNGKLTFTINTKDLPNYDEVSKANNLYLYVRETATRNGQNKILDVGSYDISKPEQKEEYIDGIKKTTPGGSSGGDGSTAPGKYPYTGKKIIIFAGFILIVLGSLGYIRYKNIDK